MDVGLQNSKEVIVIPGYCNEGAIRNKFPARPQENSMLRMTGSDDYSGFSLLSSLEISAAPPETPPILSSLFVSICTSFRLNACLD